MKKILLLMATVLLSGSAMAQLKLTPDGLVNTENEEQGFIILPFEGKTQQELYSACYAMLSAMYVSPKDVLSVAEGNSITINGVSTYAIYRKKTMTSTIPTYDINYTITIFFKDGKIRINNPIINRMYTSDSYDEQFFVSGVSLLGKSNGVFNAKGELKHEKTKISIEDFFNSYINKIKESIEKNETTDW